MFHFRKETSILNKGTLLSCNRFSTSSTLRLWLAIATKNIKILARKEKMVDIFKVKSSSDTFKSK